MKTKDEVLSVIKAGRESECLDQRDYLRLSAFLHTADWPAIGFESRDPSKDPDHIPKEWTTENILKQLEEDVAFGFEKALGQRGISSSFMYAVVKMWLWILDDDLQNHDQYTMYGLPLFKAVALKYEFDNPIGDDSGSEDKYDEP